MSRQPPAPGPPDGPDESALPSSGGTVPSADRPTEQELPLHRVVARLALGAVVTGGAEVARRLREWERQADRLASTPPDTATERAEEAVVALSETAVALGLEAQRVVGRFLGGVVRAGGVGTRVASGLWETIGTVAPSPIRRRMEAAARPVRGRLDALSAVGREEVARSRALFGAAVQDLRESGMRSLATDPQLSDLIRTQSRGMAEGFLRRARSRTSDADARLETAVKGALGRGGRRKSTPAPAPPEPAS